MGNPIPKTKSKWPKLLLRKLSPRKSLPRRTWGGFKRMTGFCKTRIPPDMMLELDRLKGDDCKEAFVEFGVQWVASLCQKIVASKLYPGLHFYCLNASERTYQIMDRLGYLRPS